MTLVVGRRFARVIALTFLVGCAAPASLPEGQPSPSPRPRFTPEPTASPRPTPTPRFELRFAFTASVPAVDRADLERGTRIGIEQSRLVLGAEIGDVVTIYAIASAAGERHGPRFDRSSCCVGGSKEFFGEFGAYYDVSDPNWNDPRVTGRARSAQHRKIAVHELIHVWQDWAGCLIRVQPPMRPAPVWFVEGVAEYLAWLFMAQAGEMTAIEVDEQESRMRAEARRLRTSVLLSSIESEHLPPERGGDINGPTVTAVKMLADASGPSALRAFCERSAKEDWRSVFPVVFGRSVDQFYVDYVADLSRP